MESGKCAAESIRYIAPEGPAVGVTRCMVEAAEKLGIFLPVPEAGTLVEVEEMDDGKVMCIFEVRQRCLP